MICFEPDKSGYKISVLRIVIPTLMCIFNLFSIIHADEVIIGKNTIDSMIFSPNPQARLGLANGILKLYPSDTLWTVGTMLKALEIELDSTNSNIQEAGNSFSYTERIVRQYIRNLESFGPTINDTLSALLNSQSEKFKNAIKIVLAKNSMESVHHDVRNILLNDSDPNFRGLAAVAITAYKDTSDILLLLKALNDPYTVTVALDYALPGQNMTEIIHPVSEDAFWALKYGFGVLPDAKSPLGYKYIEKGPK